MTTRSSTPPGLERLPQRIRYSIHELKRLAKNTPRNACPEEFRCFQVLIGNRDPDSRHMIPATMKKTDMTTRSSTPPGLERLPQRIRYSIHELKRLAKNTPRNACPEEFRYFQVLIGNRDPDSRHMIPATMKKTDHRTDWRAEGGPVTKPEGRKSRNAPQSNTGEVKLENMKKIDLPFGKSGGAGRGEEKSGRATGSSQADEKNTRHLRNSSSRDKPGGWDDVGSSSSWVGGGSSRGSARTSISAAEKLKQFEKERQEILSQRTGATTGGGGHHLEQQAAGTEGSYHTEADALMAELQAESGQLSPLPPPVVPAAALTTTTTVEVSSDLWSAPGIGGPPLDAPVDFFSEDFFSSSTPLEGTPVLSDVDSDVKRSGRLQSWLSNFVSDEGADAGGILPATGKEPRQSTSSRMRFVADSPPVSPAVIPARPTNAGQVPAAAPLPAAVDNKTHPTSPPKSTKISLNTLFSMAAKDPGSSKEATDSVTKASDVMAKLGFSGHPSPSRDGHIADLHTGTSVERVAIAATLDLLPLPTPQEPRSPFSFPIHHFAPPGTTPDPAGSSGIAASGGIATPNKISSAAQPRSGSKGVNVSASSRLLIQQQKNKRQLMQKRQQQKLAAPAKETSDAVPNTRTGQGSQNRVMEKAQDAPTSQSFANPVSDTNIKRNGVTFVQSSETKNPPCDIVNSAKGGQVSRTANNVSVISKTVDNPTTSSVSTMKKISVNSLFARAAAPKPAV